jgi:ankyrin repeat protein
MNAVDSLGNTAMHLAVIHQNMNAFDWLMKNGARRSLEHLNDQVTLSAH